MTRKASIKVMKDEVNDVVRFTHTQAITIEFTSAQISKYQLPGIREWNSETNWSSHPPIIETNVNKMMDNITKLQANKHYAVIPADGIESLAAGNHCPQAVWEMHQSLKACMSDHTHVDDDMASMHHLHSKQCILKTDGQ